MDVLDHFSRDRHIEKIGGHVDLVGPADDQPFVYAAGYLVYPFFDNVQPRYFQIIVQLPEDLSAPACIASYIQDLPVALIEIFVELGISALREVVYFAYYLLFVQISILAELHTG